MKAAGIALRLLQSLCDHLPKDPYCRRVLLDVKNTVTASYLEDLRKLFDGDKRIRFYKMAAQNVNPEDRLPSLSRVRCPEVSFMAAQLIPWDLVVMADHPRHGIGNPDRFPILRISHGIGGKMVDGQDYFYGPRLYRPDGKLRYSCIFEASHQRRQQFAVGHPQLESAVRVVGDLRIDQLRSAMLAAKPADNALPKVVIASSWSPHNLLETHGRFLLEQAKALRDRYHVVIRPHPHFFKAEASPIWKEFFAEVSQAGVTLSRSEEELSDVLASASVVICDDLSSVALYSVVLGRPTILSPSGSAQVAPNSFLGRLGKIVPNFSASDSLEDLIQHAMQTPRSAEFTALAGEINSRPGQAASLMRTEIYNLLHLVPQPAGSRLHTSDPAALALGRLA